jgi:D-glycero-alpha-D-manno-heptose 1-phosphate guanylyltransferase
VIKTLSIDIAVVLAGGLGTRLRAIVSDRPKPMAIVAGRPFLEHLLRYWTQQGIKQFVISIGYLGDNIQSHFGNNYHSVKITYVHEDRPLGTGGALLRCIKQENLSSPFLMLNGDTYFPVQLTALSHFFQSTSADIVLSLFRTVDRQRYLSVLTSEEGGGRILEIGNAGKDSGLEYWSNGGVYVINPINLQAIKPIEYPVSFEESILPFQIRQGKNVYGFRYDSNFIDIGLPEDYQLAQEMPEFFYNSRCR